MAVEAGKGGSPYAFESFPRPLNTPPARRARILETGAVLCAVPGTLVAVGLFVAGFFSPQAWLFEAPFIIGYLLIWGYHRAAYGRPVPERLLWGTSGLFHVAVASFAGFILWVARGELSVSPFLLLFGLPLLTWGIAATVLSALSLAECLRRKSVERREDQA